MTASDGMALLMETTWASSAALLLVALLRGPVCKAFGAGSAYALWALVPAALASVLLPAAVDPVAPALVWATPTLGLVAPPHYPSDAADAGEGGVVMLKLLIGADGLVQ